LLASVKLLAIKIKVIVIKQTVIVRSLFILRGFPNGLKMRICDNFWRDGVRLNTSKRLKTQSEVFVAETCDFLR
jgi:hypothetical protein